MNGRRSDVSQPRVQQRKLFRADMAAFTVPTLVIHGTGDKTVPIDPTARAAAKAIPSAQLVEYDGAPHGLTVTESDRLTKDLLTFLGR